MIQYLNAFQRGRTVMIETSTDMLMLNKQWHTSKDVIAYLKHAISVRVIL